MKRSALLVFALIATLLTACVSDSSSEQEVVNTTQESNVPTDFTASVPSPPEVSVDESTAETTSEQDNSSTAVINVSAANPVDTSTTPTTSPTNIEPSITSEAEPTEASSTPSSTDTEPSTTTEPIPEEIPTIPSSTDTEDTLPVTEATDNAETMTPATEEETTAVQAEISPWLRIPMHYEILLGQPHLWGEAGATLSLSLAEPALVETTTIELNSTDKLLPQQLISYYGTNGEYYSAQIQSIEGNKLLLNAPLEQSISAGVNAWNFYDNGSHPNYRGYYTIADFAVRFLGADQLNEGVHVLLGDSWFDDGSIFERLKQNLPAATIINKGIGGHTATDLLARFDADVLPYTPNFVWIMTGTNDYWQDVTVDAYKANIETLIEKIKALNAVPIIFDASVGPLNFGTDTVTVLSHSYVTAIDQLLTGE